MPAPREIHDLVARFDQQLEAHRSGQRSETQARTPQARTALERQVAATDVQIDRLVYDLYGLSEDEIAVVEGRSA